MTGMRRRQSVWGTGKEMSEQELLYIIIEMRIPYFVLATVVYVVSSSTGVRTVPSSNLVYT